MTRLTFLMRRKQDMSPEEFQTYWRNAHGSRVASHAHTLNVLRYVQAHTLTDESGREAGPRGTMGQPYDGVTELWWNRREDLVSALVLP